MTGPTLLTNDLNPSSSVGPSLTPLDRPVRILGIGGSTRADSITEKVLRAVLALARACPERSVRDAGARTTLASVRELALPIYNDDVPLHEQPGIVHTLLDQVRAADGFILASPTYHGTISSMSTAASLARTSMAAPLGSSRMAGRLPSMSSTRAPTASVACAECRSRRW